MKAILIGVLTLACATNVFAKIDEFTQSIYIVNQLASSKLNDVGMTPTDISIAYYNGGTNPCWTAFLNYRKDITIHAGPTQGCKNKVNRIEIKPMIMYEKLKTYANPVYVELDTAKFSTQVMVSKEKSPMFDSQSGLVAVPGTMKSTVSTQFVE